MDESQYAKSMELSNCFGTNFAPNNFHILVVDHDRIALHYISSMLKKASFSVTSSRHAYEALAILQKKKNKIGLVIADVASVFDTKDFYYLFLQGIDSDIPVIFISNRLTKALDNRSLVIMKPVNFDQLLQLVWQQFEKYFRRINSTRTGLGGNGIMSLENIMSSGVSRLSIIDEGSDRIGLIPNRSVGIRIEEPSNNNAPGGRIQTSDPQYNPRVYVNSIKGKEVITNKEEEDYWSANNSYYNNYNAVVTSNNDVQGHILNYPRSPEIKEKEFILIKDDYDDDELMNATYQEFNSGSGSGEIDNGRDLVTTEDSDEDSELMEPEGLLKRNFISDSEEDQEEEDSLDDGNVEVNIPGLMTASNENYNARYILAPLNESPSMDLSKYSFFPNKGSSGGLKRYLDQNHSLLLQNGLDKSGSLGNDFTMSVVQNPNYNKILSPGENNYGVAHLMTLQIGQESNENNGDMNTNVFNYFCSPKKSESEFGVARVLYEGDFELNIFASKRTLEDSFKYAEWLKKNPNGKSTNF